MKDTKFSLLTLVLQPCSENPLISLNEWLLEYRSLIAFIPLTFQQGVDKVIVAINDPRLYPSLLQLIFKQLNTNTVVEWQNRAYRVIGVETDPHTLHIFQIQVYPQKPLPKTLGRGIHALFFTWLAEADANLAASIHQSDLIPMSLSIFPDVVKTRMILKIGLIKPYLLSPLLYGISRHLDNDIILADVPCRLGQGIRILQNNNYHSLFQIPSQKTINLRLQSPTSFKQDKFIQPFPLPHLVFENLRKRWNQFAPEELHYPMIEWEGLTSAFELKTHALKMKGSPEIGSTGWVCYEFSSLEQAKIATTLAHFGQFAGVGRKVGMGMGQLQL
ncbi:CRISPR-associated protein Cas6 [Aphanothece hegewaldii CCALA 016]|uniref:CRISPR-associated protein Cas6 n=1 Tax=Aphanothece hegewaldii CCALA 016 TaxID=2107694 RepID=A0A2T1LYC6_9CHRO|nr:CRISPR system precrRNA processing endoribonuclease RAMP protein Cas6 [Aphanothece hegewaldii]PSF37395.1 CRISPR-associated protein Cas6 [Aphanothece hegewaldii CCALA 016]